jgi:hypothetical protein
MYGMIGSGENSPVRKFANVLPESAQPRGEDQRIR